MVTITKLLIDRDNNRLIISAKSQGAVDTDNGIIHHRFTNIYIDTTDTFNCANGYSKYATKIDLTTGSNPVGYDEDLVDYEISLHRIICEDIINELVFVYLEETSYGEGENTRIRVGVSSSEMFCFELHDGTAESMDSNAYESEKEDWPVYEGFLTLDKMLYFTDGVKYYRGFYEDDNLTSYEECSEEDYNTAHESELDTEVKVESYKKIDEYIQLDELPEYGFGITLHVSSFYNMLLSSIKVNRNECCNANCADVNTILAWNGFNLAKSLRNYKQMIYYWRLLHNLNKGQFSNCNCGA